MGRPRIRRNPGTTARATSTTTTVADLNSKAQRAQIAWRRRPRLDCGCIDACRCEFKANPTPKRVDAYAEAVAHLRQHGLMPAPLIPELRELWRRGPEDRRTVEQITTAWPVSA